jgi:putative transcriptional regulator
MSGPKRKKVRKETFGDSVISSLREFINAVDRGESITVRRIKLNLEPRDYAPEEIKWTRENLRVSQTVFARLMGVSVKTVEAWEAGKNRPTGPVCRLLEEININPMAFLRRHLESSATSVNGMLRRPMVVK